SACAPRAPAPRKPAERVRPPRPGPAPAPRLPRPARPRAPPAARRGPPPSRPPASAVPAQGPSPRHRRPLRRHRPRESLPPGRQPREDVAHRGALLQWFERMRIRPAIVAEFDDSALMKAFGQAGDGVFAAPTTIADYVCRQYGVRVLGEVPDAHARVYAITT